MHEMKRKREAEGALPSLARRRRQKPSPPSPGFEEKKNEERERKRTIGYEGRSAKEVVKSKGEMGLII